MEKIRSSGSTIARSGFKTGLDIAIEKGIDLKQELRAIEAFKKIQSFLKQPEAENNVENSQEKKSIETIQNVQVVKPIQANKSEIKKLEIFHENTGNTTTTTPEVCQDKPKVKLYRLSDFSVKILEIIRDCGAVTSRDLRDKLNKNNRYVKNYLYNLRDYGFIYRNNENWKWYLCDLDNDFFVDLNSILYNIYKGQTKDKQRTNKGQTNMDVCPLNNNNQIKIREEKSKPEAQKPLETKRLSLVQLLERAQADQTEKGVVELLACEVENEIIMKLASWCDKTHAEGTQRAYRHYESVYKFADEIGYSLVDVQAALCSLDDKGWVYTVPPNKDKYGKWKIGFTEKFLEKARNGEKA